MIFLYFRAIGDTDINSITCSYMNNIITIEELNDYFEFICKISNIDLKEIVSRDSYTGNIESYLNSQVLLNIHNLMQRQELLRAFSQCTEYLKAKLRDLKLSPLTPENLRQKAEYLTTIAAWLEKDAIVATQDRSQWLQFLYSLPLLKENEKNKDTLRDSARSDLSVVENLLEKKFIKLYKYIGSDTLDLDTLQDVIINDTFIMSQELSPMLSTLLPIGDEKIRFSLMLKIEEIFHFSYFLIGIQYKNSVYLATDQPIFATPGSRYCISQRGNSFDQNANLEATILPYRWLDEISKYRHKSPAIPTNLNNFEHYTAKITNDFSVNERIFLNLLFNEIAKRIAIEGDFEKVETFLTHLDRIPFSLTDGNIEMPQEDLNNLLGLDENREECDCYSKDLITLDPKPLPVIARFSKQEMISQIPAFTNSLLTEEKFRKDIAWSILNTQRNDRQSALNKLKENRQKDALVIADSLINNFAEYAPWLFAGEKVFIYFMDIPVHNEYRNKKLVLPLNSVDNNFNGLPSLNKQKLCPCCQDHTYKKNNHYGLNFYHYSQLQFFTGKKRLQLPPYFINYRRCSFIPDSGNFLLENVNPLHELRDPASEDYRNKLHFDFYLCGYCKKRLEKYLRFDEALILFSIEKAQPVDVVDYAIWSQEHKQ